MSPAALRAALRLTVILDPSAAAGRNLAAIGRTAADAGAGMLQLRAKSLDSSSLAELARDIIAAAGTVPVIVNDRLDVALAAGAAGAHFGPDDLPIRAARGVAPPGFVIGASAGTVEEALAAEQDGADYLGIGPIHATASKDDAGAAIGYEGFRRIRQASRLPAVAIGGVTPADGAPLTEAGAAGVAVIRYVLGAADVGAAVAEMRRSVE